MKKLLLLGLALLLPGCSPEPVFKGRTAGMWRQDLKHGDAMARAHAAAALALIEPPSKAAIPDLITCLKDGDYIVRHEAAAALAHIGPDAKAAVPALLELRKDWHPRVREAAVRALKIIDPEAAPKAEGSAADRPPEAGP
jgi:HEAT repeat protein